MISYKEKSDKLKSEFYGFDFNMNNLTCAVIALLEEISAKLDKLDTMSEKLDSCGCNCEPKDTVEKKAAVTKK